MKTTIYACDRCDWKQDRDRKFDGPYRWMRTVSILMEDGHHDIGYGSRLDGSDMIKSVFWCDVCCAAVGLARHRPVPKADEPPPPTIEDMLREIIREEMGNQ